MSLLVWKVRWVTGIILIMDEIMGSRMSVVVLQSFCSKISACRLRTLIESSMHVSSTTTKLLPSSDATFFIAFQLQSPIVRRRSRQVAAVPLGVILKFGYLFSGIALASLAQIAYEYEYVCCGRVYISNCPTDRPSSSFVSWVEISRRCRSLRRTITAVEISNHFKNGWKVTTSTPSPQFVVISSNNVSTFQPTNAISRLASSQRNAYSLMFVKQKNPENILPYDLCAFKAILLS